MEIFALSAGRLRKLMTSLGLVPIESYMRDTELVQNPHQVVHGMEDECKSCLSRNLVVGPSGASLLWDGHEHAAATF